MNRPAWMSMIPVTAAGVVAADLYVIVVVIASGDDASFLAFGLALASGIGLVGSAIGFVPARLVRTSRFGRVAVAGVSTFLATLAVGNPPGLIGVAGLAVVVAVATAGALALIEWRQSRTTGTQPH
ncbi:hypothetical protein QMG61_16415 [Cryobacterium sp. PH31-AA6]|uniref:hypothetical protein n=1 Tax=Cryobacterium sp. PH31-AA6 TaxID=3046205 RepID=UPI0024BA0D29|nr:hypothetical protein [Cryobacterium sp. PH31-AA6]MDJ0325351.1 hypothetical protein [Cryobacterium sp. PH31-AA6]